MAVSSQGDEGNDRLAGGEGDGGSGVGMIDPTAVIDAAALLAEDVRVGPCSVIGPDVQIGSGTVIGPHVTIQGPTRIGRDNRIQGFVSLGGDSRRPGTGSGGLEIGDRNTFREFGSVYRGTEEGSGVTRIGHDNLVMSYVHVGNDCLVGDHVTLVNAATLAGHNVVEDHVIVSGFVVVDMHCRIGTHSFCSMGSAIHRDVPPYVTVAGKKAVPRGVNSEGLRRRGFAPARIKMIRKAFRLLYRSGMRLDDAVRELERLAEGHDDLRPLADFVRASGRSILR